MIILSFLFFLLLFVVVGVASAFFRHKNNADYLIAGRSVKPWLVALSAVATNNSGYMFVGQIGFTYMYGLHSIWLMIGWITGDFLSSLFVHKKLRQQSEKEKSLSFAATLSEWGGQNYKYLRFIGGIITILFLGTYAAAQLNAGSKALHVLFGWDYAFGAIIGAAIVLLYCMAGGIRASIWTDAAQSFVMIIAMVLMVVVGVNEIGGLSAFTEGLHNVSPDYMNLFPPANDFGGALGPALFVLGWLFAGVGVIGQPHIMVRFMALDNPSHITRTRAYYYAWFTTFYVMTIIAALVARLLITDTGSFDAELALPTLAEQLLPSVLVGLVLAGLFAATMSTADSQILSCTASITNDLWPNKKFGYMANKIATFAVTLIALAIALNGNKSVFALVLIAWSALGSAFGPLLIVRSLKQDVSELVSVAMVLGGIGGMLVWRSYGLNDITYEIAPGMLTGFVIFGVSKAIGALSSSAKDDAADTQKQGKTA